MSDLVKSTNPEVRPSSSVTRNPLLDLVLLALRPQAVPAESSAAAWIRNHPVASLIGLAYGLTWVGLIPLILNPSLPTDPRHITLSLLVVAFLGMLGCLWAALIVASATSGVAGRLALLRGYLRWKTGFQWYVVVLLTPAIMWLAAIGLDRLFSGELPSVPVLKMLPATLLASYGFYLVRYMFGNYEEICWRASLLPRMQARYGALTASAIVGVVQGLWHLPYAFMRGSFVQVIGLPAMVLLSVAMGVVLTWAFNGTRGSLLMVALFHAAFDAWSPFQGSDLRLSHLMIVAWCIAAIAVAIATSGRLNQKANLEMGSASPEL